MSFSVFADFADSNIDSWIKGDLSDFGQKTVLVAVRKIIQKKLDVLRFIAAGAALALSVGSVAAQPSKISDSAKEQQNVWIVPFQYSSGPTAMAHAARLSERTQTSVTSIPGRFALENLLPTATRAALGASGLARLSEFSQLCAGWDGGDGHPMSFASLAHLNRFFEITQFQSDGLGLFMSQDGNLIINWLDDTGGIVELEFENSFVSMFLERAGSSRSFTTSDASFGKSILALVNS